MASSVKLAPQEIADARATVGPLPPFFSIPDLAERWRCSRASVYNRIRGEKVIDFAPNPRAKGHKLVPVEVVLRIERSHMRVLR